MNKIKGRVRNYVVTDKDVFCDSLAKSLCQMNIEYVQIENEFHFNDMIYRFYSISEYAQLQEVIAIAMNAEDKVMLLSNDLLLNKDPHYLEKLFNQESDLEIESPEIKFDGMKKININFRQNLNHESKMVKQKIKNSYKQPAYRSRHFK